MASIMGDFDFFLFPFSFLQTIGTILFDLYFKNELLKKT